MPAEHCEGRQYRLSQSSRNVDCLAAYAINPDGSDHKCIMYMQTLNDEVISYKHDYTHTEIRAEINNANSRPAQKLKSEA